MTPAVDLALHDCGPCLTPGPAVRDHLPPWLSPDARSFILARLDHGERLYGAVLRIGWAPARLEFAQELADATIYATVMGAPEGLLRDVVAAYETSLRLARVASFAPAPRRRSRIAAALRALAAWWES